MTNENTFYPERFSDDPHENLRIENEILRMKLQAQYGGISSAESDISPEEENQFLKHVLAFEEQYANATLKKVYEVIGCPAFEKADALDDMAISRELGRIEQLLAHNNIELGFLKPQNDRFKYSFITDELFEYEMEDIKVAGMINCFTYEEFHPDHEMEIRNRTSSFLTGWFKKAPHEIGQWLSDQFVYPDGRTMSRDGVKQKFNQAFAAYSSFENTEYLIDNVSYELKDEPLGLLATGYSEGKVKYTAVYENGESRSIEGPFKIYFGCEYGWWNIFFFYLPGFND